VTCSTVEADVSVLCLQTMTEIAGKFNDKDFWSLGACETLEQYISCTLSWSRCTLSFGTLTICHHFKRGRILNCSRSKHFLNIFPDDIPGLLLDGFSINSSGTLSLQLFYLMHHLALQLSAEKIIGSFPCDGQNCRDITFSHFAYHFPDVMKSVPSTEQV